MAIHGTSAFDGRLLFDHRTGFTELSGFSASSEHESKITDIKNKKGYRVNRCFILSTIVMCGNIYIISLLYNDGATDPSHYSVNKSQKVFVSGGYHASESASR
jgi:hypothetical protein